MLPPYFFVIFFMIIKLLKAMMLYTFLVFVFNYILCSGNLSGIS